MTTVNKNQNLTRADQVEEALALLAAGIPPETILAEAGQDAHWLRPLLEIAGDVGDLQQAIPIPPPNASLQKLLVQGRQMAAPLPPPVSSPPARPTYLSLLFKGAAGLAAALLIVVLMGGALTVAAQRSLPGDTLYWVKQAGEDVRLALTQDPRQRADLLEAFNQRRLLEIETLLEQDKEARVSFEQTVASFTPNEVKVDGMTVAITEETGIIGQLAVGARVQIEALTRPPDRLVGLTIRVTEPGPAGQPTVTPTPTSQPEPSPTPTLSQSQATDSLTAPTPARSQEADTIELPPTPAAEEGDDQDNTNLDDDGNANESPDDNANQDGDDDNINDNKNEAGEDEDGLDEIDDDNQIGDDSPDNEEEFNDNDDLDEGDDFRDDDSNDDDQDREDDHSGDDNGDDDISFEGPDYGGDGGGGSDGGNDTGGGSDDDDGDDDGNDDNDS